MNPNRSALGAGVAATLAAGMLWGLVFLVPLLFRVPLAMFKLDEAA